MGQASRGGYDIFSSVGSAKKWTKAEAMPEPFNSSYDDYYFVCFNDGKEGYMTSNRPESFQVRENTCCDDIFQFKIEECNVVIGHGTIINYANYDFYDELNAKFNLGLSYPKNNAPIANIPVELYLDKDQETFLISSATTDENGSYHFKMERNQHYKIRVKNMGYFDKNIAVSTFQENCNDIKISETVISYLPEIQIRLNIYYEYNKSNLTDQAKTVVDTMLLPLFDLFPNAIIEIGSHTDNMGSDSYNLKLSQNRSESVVKYLTSKGIAPERLVAKGYGESQPVAPNENPDGTDNPEGRQLNRRTELKILGETNSFYRDE
jgi:outer membrane protein OmpA-like peptidoglycan-associated protein